MPDFFSTTDISASVHKAFEAYTHVILNRSYHVITPVYFNTALVADLPIFIYAGWDKGTFGSRSRWQEKGGVLIDRGRSGQTGERDALVVVESPMSWEQLKGNLDGTDKQVIIAKPQSWKVHEWAVEMWNPEPKKIQDAYALLNEVPDRAHMAALTRYPDSGIVLTDSEVSSATGTPIHQVLFLRRIIDSREVWAVKPRLAPTAPNLIAAWEAIVGQEDVKGARLFTDLGRPGGEPWKRPVREMARLGHVSVTKFHVYPTKEPNYDKLKVQHREALRDFGLFQEFVESLSNY